MNHDGEISRSERRHLAVAAVTLGPWRTAARAGAIGGAVVFGLNLMDGIWLGALGEALSFALMLFLIVGGAGSILGGRAATSAASTSWTGLPVPATSETRADRRIQRWAAEHPWHVAAVPGALMALGDLVVSQAVTTRSFFGGVGDAIWMGVLVWLVVALVGRFSTRKG